MESKSHFEASSDGDHSTELYSDKNFGITFCVLSEFLGIFQLAKQNYVGLIGIFLGFFFLILAFFKPQFLTPFNKRWQKLSIRLSKLTQPVVLGILFFMVFTPVSLVLKLRGKRMLETHFDSDLDSYWKSRVRSNELTSMKNQF